jgi:hypothetical protein
MNKSTLISFVIGRMVPKEVVGRNISAASPVNYSLSQFFFKKFCLYASV